MRVLIVDNNLSNSLVVRSILERENHRVTLASNGAQAIVMAQSDPQDVILLDIVMPVMNGFETVKYLQKFNTTPPFIFALSAYDDVEDVIDYKRAGFDGLIAKPLRRGDLAAALGSVLLGSRSVDIGVAANAQDAAARPLLDETIIRDGAGSADASTRQRIWETYRSSLSESLKTMSRSLPGYLNREPSSIAGFQSALHALRSTSLTVGMNRVPYLAKQLRHTPPDCAVEAIGDLLHAVRDSLPLLEPFMGKFSESSVIPR